MTKVRVDGIDRDATPDEEAEIEARSIPDPAAIAAAMADYLDEVRGLREKILNRLAGIAAAALASSDADTTTAFVSARQRLLDITRIPAVQAATNRAELESAVKAEYADIVATTVPAIVSAFRQVDA